MPARLFVTVNGSQEPLVFERAHPRAPWTLPKDAAPDIVHAGGGQYSLMHRGRSFRALVLKEDRTTNTIRLRVGASTYTVHIQDEQSRSMQQLGLDKARNTLMAD